MPDLEEEYNNIEGQQDIPHFDARGYNLAGQPSRAGEYLDLPGKLYNLMIYLIVGVFFFFAVSMIMISIDLRENRDFYESIVELEREISIYRNESLNYQRIILEKELRKTSEVLDCFKNKKYWQYGECFK